MRYLSLFSGAGGGDLGCQHLLGWECVGYVEWEEYPCKVLEARIEDGMLSDAPIWQGDIREFNRRVADRYRGVADVVTGGFPCQPFSVAGKQAGADDERNMWPATLDTISRVRPEWCLLENVPGLVSTGYLGTIVGGLSEIGYDCRWGIVSAADVGARHLRERLWIVAMADAESGRFRDNAMGNVGIYQPDQLPDDARIGSLYSGARSYWTVEPRVGRVAYGVAHRVDRLKALGNGQVPLVAAVAWDRLHRDLIG